MIDNGCRNICESRIRLSIDNSFLNAKYMKTTHPYNSGCVVGRKRNIQIGVKRGELNLYLRPVVTSPFDGGSRQVCTQENFPWTENFSLPYELPHAQLITLRQKKFSCRMKIFQSVNGPKVENIDHCIHGTTLKLYIWCMRFKLSCLQNVHVKALYIFCLTVV